MKRAKIILADKIRWRIKKGSYKYEVGKSGGKNCRLRQDYLEIVIYAGLFFNP